MALAARMPVPRGYIIDDPAPNAFATGRDPEHSVICVTADWSMRWIAKNCRA